MRKYIIYIEPGTMSPAGLKKHVSDLLTNLKKEGIIGQHDIACVMTSSGPTRIETLPMSIFEKLSIFVDRFLGKIGRFDSRR